MFPMLLDMPVDQCHKTLRRLELEAYSSVVSALRAQGAFTKRKRKILRLLGKQCIISVERQKAEIRRAANDEVLETIAHKIYGPNTGEAWITAGRRYVPLIPRLIPRTKWTALADYYAGKYSDTNASLPEPSQTMTPKRVSKETVATGTSVPMVAAGTTKPGKSQALGRQPRKDIVKEIGQVRPGGDVQIVELEAMEKGEEVELESFDESKEEDEQIQLDSGDERDHEDGEKELKEDLEEAEDMNHPRAQDPLTSTKLICQPASPPLSTYVAAQSLVCPPSPGSNVTVCGDEDRTTKGAIPIPDWTEIHRGESQKRKRHVTFNLPPEKYSKVEAASKAARPTSIPISSHSAHKLQKTAVLTSTDSSCGLKSKVPTIINFTPRTVQPLKVVSTAPAGRAQPLNKTNVILVQKTGARAKPEHAVGNVIGRPGARSVASSMSLVNSMGSSPSVPSGAAPPISTTSSNVIVLDLTQENVKNNPFLADILQSSLSGMKSENDETAISTSSGHLVASTSTVEEIPVITGTSTSTDLSECHWSFYPNSSNAHETQVIELSSSAQTIPLGSQAIPISMLEAVIEAMSKGNAIPEGSTAEVLTPVTDIEGESTQGLKILTIPVSEGMSWSSDSSSPIIMDPKTVVKIVAENQGKGLTPSIGPPFGTPRIVGGQQNRASSIKPPPLKFCVVTPIKPVTVTIPKNDNSPCPSNHSSPSSITVVNQHGRTFPSGSSMNLSTSVEPPHKRNTSSVILGPNALHASAPVFGPQNCRAASLNFSMQVPSPSP
ncbi:unnamed protein product [Darwinula stevensoni]|uniref:ENT domain-containing protein n=1 Tax=Darwinula stevensoni TaxID=69355 RepID=A0A7R8XEU1_9CRUS|nr:unnamed protein product [Darwinula stevensoni]CAG0890955.1 unnamed protein product [Darwinula stevensoni]